MLSFFPEGVMPQESHIANGAELNPDGHGFAIVTKQRTLMIQKSMDPDALIAQFMKARRDNLEGPALFHSRIATSGRVDITGCHPFRVGQDNRTVLAHNGILFNPRDPERSDTRIFAEDMLPRMGSLDKGKKRRAIEKFVGRGNKILVLTVNPQRRDTAYLLNPGAGTWTPSGAWHSNYDYKGKWWDDDAYLRNGVTNAGKPKVIRYGNSAFPCEICGAYDSVSMADGVCDVCNSCNDCKMNMNMCLCYVPSGVVRDKAGSGTWTRTESGGWAYNS
jgi:glutamine amidotransferase